MYFAMWAYHSCAYHNTVSRHRYYHRYRPQLYLSGATECLVSQRPKELLPEQW